jgi:signal transduction histidine kinase/response regulator RpfG family c-di-GMP phosphodiesterase
MNTRERAREVTARGKVLALDHLRLLEVASFFLIVYVTRIIAGFRLPDRYLLPWFAAAFLFQALYGWRVRRRKSRESDRIPAIFSRRHLWITTVADMVTVLGVVHLTGGVESPFLTLILIPVFFGSRVFCTRGSGFRIVLVMAAAFGVMALLEWRTNLSHWDVYPAWGGEAYQSFPFVLATFVVVTGLMALVVNLAVAFRDRFTLELQVVLKDLEKESSRRIHDLTRLYDISTGINSAMSMETLLKLAAKEATLLLRADWSCVLLFNRDLENTFSSAVGIPPDLVERLRSAEKGTLTRTIIEQRAASTLATSGPARFLGHTRDDEGSSRDGLGSVVGVPIASDSHVGGVFYVGQWDPREFGEDDLNLLGLLAGQLSSAVEKSRVYEAMQGKLNDLQKQVDELVNSNKLKSDFVSHVSHELKTPLTSIKAYIEALLTNIDNPEFPEAGNFLQVVSSETERLIRIVNKILDVSQIEFGKRSLSREAFPLGALVKEVEASFMPTLKERGIFLVTRIPEDLPRLDADRDLVKQIFVNLIGNAVKFSPDHSHVYVEAAEEAVTIKVSVRDEGVGIPEEDLPHIFEQFYKVKSHEELSPEGTGLGLAIVKNVVESHGGGIFADSPSEGGTTFTFILPKEHCSSRKDGYVFELIQDEEGLRELLDTVVRVMAEVFSAKIVSLMLLDSERKHLHVQVAFGLEEEIVENSRVAVGSGIAGRVVERNVPVLIENIERNEIYSSVNNPQYETVSLISAPISVKDACVGVINVNNKTSQNPFNQDDLNLLVMLCERVTRSLGRLSELEDTEPLMRSTVLAFQSMIDWHRTPLHVCTGFQAKRAATMARKLRLTDKEVRVIQYVASVHDVGMARISDDILNKVVALTQEEMEEIRHHPELGADLLRPLEFVEMVSKNILYHHEHMDGRGYPMGLKGEDIPIGSRIVAVLDAFQSLVSPRPYRKPVSDREAVEEIVRCSGTQFDPRVVSVFLETLREEGRIDASTLESFRSRLTPVREYSHHL